MVLLEDGGLAAGASTEQSGIAGGGDAGVARWRMGADAVLDQLPYGGRSGDFRWRQAVPAAAAHPKIRPSATLSCAINSRQAN